MTLELVRTTTPDGLRLDGRWTIPSPRPRAVGIDALVLLHGVGGSFYGGQMFEALTPCLLELGIAVLRVNTRGHGSVSVIPGNGGSRLQGAAFETVAECVHDVGAWTAWLLARGYERIGLLGHSLGAIKGLYAAAHGLPPEVRGLIAVSPPRLSYGAFVEGPQSSLFLDSISTAQQHVADGNPQALFTARFPFPLLISAASYVDKYGPDERYNFLQFLDRVALPTLFVYGERELDPRSPAFAGLPELIGRRCSPSRPPLVLVVPGADHFYVGAYEQLGGVIRSWLEQCLPLEQARQS
jgi:pimeloyl-ACP methyl ester carboxylesterase